MKHKTFKLVAIIVLTAVYIGLSVHDYQNLFDWTLTVMFIRWGIIATILFLSISTPIKKFVKIILTLLLLFIFVSNEYFRPLRKHALQTFLHSRKGEYLNVMTTLNKVDKIHTVTLDQDDKDLNFKGRDGKHISKTCMDSNTFKYLQDIFIDLQLAKITVENKQYLFLHGSADNTCGLLYFGLTNDRKDFKNIETNNYIKLTDNWYYFGTLKTNNNLLPSGVEDEE